jgi:hypothetical protein
VTVKRNLSRRAALKFWSDLRSHFVNAENTIREIIEHRAWEPLGYVTFAEAWSSQMADVALAEEIRPHVVYQMLSEGVNADDIALAVKGVGPKTVELLASQRRNGVPPGMASVRAHYRRPACAPSHIRIDVGSTMLAEYHRAALIDGRSVEDIAKEAVRERFSELVSAQSKRKASA